MKKIFFFFLLIAGIDAMAQNAGIGTTVPHSTAMLEVRSTNKGFLMPRLTAAARQAMFDVPAGMMVYDTDASTFYFHDGNKWRPISDKNADSSLIDYGATPEATANISFFEETTAKSGILYDNGGPAGNYPNNANHDYICKIGTSSSALNDSIMMFKVEIEEISLESPHDSLIIYTSGASRIMITGTTPKTFYFPATDDLHFKFLSNATNTQAGFKIRWTQLIGRTTEIAPRFGWYFDDQRRAVRGGINVMNDWRTPDLGNLSFGWGSATQATGDYSIAMGRELTASNRNSIAIGTFNQSTGISSVAIGSSNYAIGNTSFAMGASNRAIGDQSVALGNQNTASGDYSLAATSGSKAPGVYGVSMGNGTIAKGFTTALGRFNDTIGNVSESGWVTGEPLFTIGNGSNNSSRNNAMMITKEGNMAIGVRIPDVRLHIGGGSDASLSDGSGYMVIGPLTGTNIVFDNNEIIARNNGVSSTLFLQNGGGAFEVGGTAAKPGGGSWSATSDARLKDQVRPYADGLQQLLGINPVYYHYNKQSGYDTKQEYIGVLAQELQTIAPYMVKTFKKEDKEFLSVDNTAMTFMLINAVKEQQQQIEESKKMIAELKRKIEVLEKR